MCERALVCWYAPDVYHVNCVLRVSDWSVCSGRMCRHPSILSNHGESWQDYSLHRFIRIIDYQSTCRTVDMGVERVVC